nr:recombinase family protein [uncultured Anaerosporobacter sp.]
MYDLKGNIMNIAYVRVSSVDQNEARQREALAKFNIEKWYVEKVSGKNTNRIQLQAMLEFAREGDTIYIHDLSRLARNTVDLLKIVDILNRKQIHLVSNKENIDSSTPTGKLMLTMIGAINQFERESLKERQREGIEIAKRDGRYKGRKRITVSNFDDYYQRYMKREINKVQLAKELNIHRATLDRIINEYEDKIIKEYLKR